MKKPERPLCEAVKGRPELQRRPGIGGDTTDACQRELNTRSEISLTGNIHRRQQRWTGRAVSRVPVMGHGASGFDS